MEERPQKKQKRRQQQQHYVFGYGSLICPESRAATAEALRGGGTRKGDEGAATDDGAIPVRLNHWVRMWNIQGTHTYLGVQRCASNDDEVTKDAAKAKTQPEEEKEETEDSATGGGVGVSPAAAAAGVPSSETTAPASHVRPRPSTHRSCVGVLVPLPSSDDDDGDNNTVLEALDRREHAYRRERVDPGWIERVDDLLLGDDEDGGGGGEQLHRRKQAIHDKYYKGTFWETRGQPQHSTEIEEGSGDPGATDGGDPDAVCVWIYVPLEKYRGMARPDCPILQSYVDICIKGCLSISKAFAKEWVEGSYGWYTGHSHETPGDNESDEKDPNHGASSTTPVGDSSSSSSCWMNDRNKPVYIRADKDYSLKHSKSLDAVFDPFLLRRRGPMGQNP